MKNKNKFRAELVELLYKYDLNVVDFVGMVRNDEFWLCRYKKIKKSD